MTENDIEKLLTMEAELNRVHLEQIQYFAATQSGQLKGYCNRRRLRSAHIRTFFTISIVFICSFTYASNINKPDYEQITTNDKLGSSHVYSVLLRTMNNI